MEPSSIGRLVCADTTSGSVQAPQLEQVWLQPPGLTPRGDAVVITWMGHFKPMEEGLGRSQQAVLSLREGYTRSLLRVASCSQGLRLLFSIVSPVPTIARAHDRLLINIS